MNAENIPNEKDLWKRIPETEGEERADILISLSYIASQKRDYKECFALCDTAREIYESLGVAGSNATLAMAYKGMAHSLVHMERPVEAALALDRSIELYREIGSGELLTALRIEADVWYETKEYEKSLEFYEKVLAEPNPDITNEQLGHDNYNLATTLVKLERWESALAAFLKARRIYKSEHLPLQVACCDEEISLCYFKMDQGLDAERHANMALDFAHTSRQDERIFWSTVRLGYAKKLLGEFVEAKSLVEKALEKLLEEEDGNWNMVVRLEKERAEILTALGDEDGSAAILRRIKVIEETLAE